MKDVASEAGVALGTVSKVVNGKPVGEEYEKKVREAIRKLNYHVNSYAQGLKASKTYTIVVILPNTYTPFYGNLAFYLNKSLYSHGYRMLLCCSEFDSGREQQYVEMAVQNKVDGIIGLTYNPDLQIPPEVPFISIDRSFDTGVPCVSSDNFMGGQMAAEKLADLGCTRVAFLRQGSGLKNEPNKRKAGFENGCALRGLPYEIKMIGDGVPLTVFEDYLNDHMHDGVLDFDGLFCVTDTLAYEVRRMLMKMGLTVPGDVQIIGYDGVRHFGNRGYTCSTIVQPVAQIADMCVDYLVQDQGRIRPQLSCLPVHYAAGGTTKDMDELEQNTWQNEIDAL
ncbi:MAG: LacI family DNA-binding transcriptional regulator [Lachnospiraceae bacterium]|nr:LacI family DNA-binding transcriptional regulator [Lachnospiraceae bacterium]